MNVFDLYSAYYDLLYRDKDYASEARYVKALVQEVVPDAGYILELGCGTGAHAAQLAQLGFRVHGIDLSDGMVERARRRASLEPAAICQRVSFQRGDVRRYRDSRTYDAVLSLFHVLSYQVTDADQADTFATARVHLRKGGVFVFDFWHGPAVLGDPPRIVTKEVADSRIEVRRRTTPVVHENEHVVDVRFDIEITSRSDGNRERFDELHRMRYLFMPEIRQRLSAAGFEVISARRWMTVDAIDDHSWYGCVSARAC